MVLFATAIAGVLSVLGTLPAAAQTTIPAGVPLRIEVDHRYRVRPGTRIEGHLIAPDYVKTFRVPAERTAGLNFGPRQSEQCLLNMPTMR
jgi:hypothetical protein